MFETTLLEFSIRAAITCGLIFVVWFLVGVATQLLRRRKPTTSAWFIRGGLFAFVILATSFATVFPSILDRRLQANSEWLDPANLNREPFEFSDQGFTLGEALRSVKNGDPLYSYNPATGEFQAASCEWLDDDNKDWGLSERHKKALALSCRTDRRTLVAEAIEAFEGATQIAGIRLSRTETCPDSTFPYLAEAPPSCLTSSWETELSLQVRPILNASEQQAGGTIGRPQKSSVVIQPKPITPSPRLYGSLNCLRGASSGQGLFRDWHGVELIAGKKENSRLENYFFSIKLTEQPPDPLIIQLIAAQFDPGDIEVASPNGNTKKISPDNIIYLESKPPLAANGRIERNCPLWLPKNGVARSDADMAHLSLRGVSAGDEIRLPVTPIIARPVPFEAEFLDHHEFFRRVLSEEGLGNAEGCRIEMQSFGLAAAEYLCSFAEIELACKSAVSLLEHENCVRRYRSREDAVARPPDFQRVASLNILLEMLSRQGGYPLLLKIDRTTSEIYEVRPPIRTDGPLAIFCMRPRRPRQTDDGGTQIGSNSSDDAINSLCTLIWTQGARVPFKDRERLDLPENTLIETPSNPGGYQTVLQREQEAQGAPITTVSVDIAEVDLSTDPLRRSTSPSGYRLSDAWLYHPEPDANCEQWKKVNPQVDAASAPPGLGLGAVLGIWRQNSGTALNRLGTTKEGPALEDELTINLFWQCIASRILVNVSDEGLASQQPARQSDDRKKTYWPSEEMRSAALIIVDLKRDSLGAIKAAGVWPPASLKENAWDLAANEIWQPANAPLLHGAWRRSDSEQTIGSTAKLITASAMIDRLGDSNTATKHRDLIEAMINGAQFIDTTRLPVPKTNVSRDETRRFERAKDEIAKCLDQSADIDQRKFRYIYCVTSSSRFTSVADCPGDGLNMCAALTRSSNSYFAAANLILELGLEAPDETNPGLWSTQDFVEMLLNRCSRAAGKPSNEWNPETSDAQFRTLNRMSPQRRFDVFRPDTNRPGYGSGVVVPVRFAARSARDDRTCLEIALNGIGQGVNGPPLHVLAAMASIATEQQNIRPYMFRDASVPPEAQPAFTLRQEGAQRALIEGLEKVVESGAGTGAALNSLPVKIYAKTGTAIPEAIREESDRRNTSWVVGWWQSDESSEPEFAFICMLTHVKVGSASCTDDVIKPFLQAVLQ